MKSNFSLFLALRYLQPKRSFVSIITLISVLGVLFGVTALYVVLAVFTGFGDRITDSFLGFEPHIMITEPGGRIFEDWYDVAADISEMPDVDGVTPYVQGQVIMDFDGRRLAPQIRAIDPTDENVVGRMAEKTVEGAFLIDLETCVIGDELASGLGINVGDKITLNSPKDANTVMDALDRARAASTKEETDAALDSVSAITVPQELEVTGIFDSGHYDFDANYIFCHVETGGVLYNLGSGVHGIAVFAKDGMKAKELRNSILEKFEGERVQLARATHPTWKKISFFLSITVFVVAIIVLFNVWGSPQAVIVTIIGALILGIGVPMIPIYGNSNYLVENSYVAGLTWMELHGALLNAVAMERQMMYFLLLLLVVVSAFCIMNTMITVVYQKRSEIGLLKAIGATQWQISKIFLVQGAIVGLLGIALGLLSGYLIVEYRNEILGQLGESLGLQMLSEEIYKFEGLPATRTWEDTLSIGFGAIVACICASIVPAFIASRMEPAEALRTD